MMIRCWHRRWGKIIQFNFLHKKWARHGSHTVARAQTHKKSFTSAADGFTQTQKKNPGENRPEWNPSHKKRRSTSQKLKKNTATVDKGKMKSTQEERDVWWYNTVCVCVCDCYCTHTHPLTLLKKKRKNSLVQHWIAPGLQRRRLRGGRDRGERERERKKETDRQREERLWD